MRRGFKTEATQTASDLRQELGLQDLQRLDAYALAECLAIPVRFLADFVGKVPRVERLRDTYSAEFSALTIVDGKRRLIVVNDAHSVERCASNVTHECAHAILGHPAEAAFADNGCRTFDRGIEDEANELAGCLLVTRAAALRAARSGEFADWAQRLGVSVAMLRWRVNSTGAGIQARRELLRS